MNNASFIFRKINPENADSIVFEIKKLVGNHDISIIFFNSLFSMKIEKKDLDNIDIWIKWIYYLPIFNKNTNNQFQSDLLTDSIQKLDSLKKEKADFISYQIIGCWFSCLLTVNFIDSNKYSQIFRNIIKLSHLKVSEIVSIVYLSLTISGKIIDDQECPMTNCWFLFNFLNMNMKECNRNLKLKIFDLLDLRKMGWNRNIYSSYFEGSIDIKTIKSVQDKKQNEDEIQKQKEQIRKQKEEQIRKQREEQIRKQREEQIRKQREEQIRKQREEEIEEEEEEREEEEEEDLIEFIVPECDEDQFSYLYSIFTINAQSGIDESLQYLNDSPEQTYEDFIEEIKSTQKKNSCTKASNHQMFWGHCFDCSKDDSSCFCIQCFVEGHHDQHNSCILLDSSGSCDCGNPSFIKKAGFCPRHSGPEPNPHITQMTPINCMKFITVFKSAFYSAIKCRKIEIMKEIFHFISEFIDLGDGIRRCASIAIYSISEQLLYERIPEMSGQIGKCLIEFFGQFITDLYFIQNMSFLHFKNYFTLAEKLQLFLVDDNRVKLLPFINYLSFEHHYFNRFSIISAIQHKNFNWPDFLINYMSISINTIKLTDYEYVNNKNCTIIDRISNIAQILSVALSMKNQHDKIQEFIDKYCNFLISYEGLISYHVETTLQYKSEEGFVLKDLTSHFSYLNSFFSINNKNKASNNKLFSITSCILSIVQFCNNNKIECSSILNIQKKIKISTFLPLHNLFFYLLSNYKNTKTIVENECKQLNISFQYFCSIAMISPLRVVSSYFLIHKFELLNTGFYKNLLLFNTKNVNVFNSYFGLVQTLIGIAPNQEELLQKVLTTFGVLEDVFSFSRMDPKLIERQYDYLKDIHFESSIFLLSLLTDNSILLFDEINYKRLRVIEFLKIVNFTHALSIRTFINDNLTNPTLNDILSEYIERVYSKQHQSIFRLKNEGDFTPFFPPISLKYILNMLAKYNDKLIPVSDYSELPREISLRNCFRSPSFIALTFKMLSSIDNTLFKKIGFSMFISLVRNGPKIPPESFNVQNPITIRGKNMIDLILELNKIKDNFGKVNILTINFQLENMKPNSIIDLVKMDQQFGYLAIQKAELSISFQNQDEKFSQLIQDRKKKAALLKQDLLKRFQDKQKQFILTNNVSKAKKTQLQNNSIENNNDKNMNNENLNDKNLNNDRLNDKTLNDECLNDKDLNNDSLNDDDDDKQEDLENDDESEIICHACLDKKDSIFGFPCLSIPTTLPSFVDDKLHNKKTSSLKLKETYLMNICVHPIHFNCFIGLPIKNNIN